MRFKKGIAACLIVLGGGVVFFATRTGTEMTTETATPETEAAPVLAMTHTYKKGTHTFAGTLAAPTPCDQVAAEAAVGADGVITISVTHTAAEGMCLMRATDIPFSVSIAAAEQAGTKVLVNGVEVSVAIK